MKSRQRKGKKSSIFKDEVMRCSRRGASPATPRPGRDPPMTRRGGGILSLNASSLWRAPKGLQTVSFFAVQLSVNRRLLRVRISFQAQGPGPPPLSGVAASAWPLSGLGFDRAAINTSLLCGPVLSPSHTNGLVVTLRWGSLCSIT